MTEEERKKQFDEYNHKIKPFDDYINQIKDDYDYVLEDKHINWLEEYFKNIDKYVDFFYELKDIVENLGNLK